MRFRVGLTCFIMMLGFIWLDSATHKNRKIDGKHFSAKLTQAGNDTEYKADVVFVGKAVNIRFLDGQMMPPTTRNDRLLTLYLYDEIVSDPLRVHLKQVLPPVSKRRGDDNPDNWEIVAEWWMSVDLDN